MRLFDVFSYNDGQLVTESLNVQQLAAISDEALDNKYHYGRSTPGNTFGWQANLASAAYAKQAIESGFTKIDQISDAVHKGWWSVAQKFVDDPDQFSDTETLRAKGKFDKKMADRIAQMVPFNQLTKDQQDIDREVAEALLQAITGGSEQGVAEGILGSDPNRGQKVPGWAKGGVIGKIGRKLDPAWSDIQMTVPQHLLSKQSSVPATNSPATKDMPKVKATSIIPTRAIPQRAGNNSSHPVTKNVVKTIADKSGVAEGSDRVDSLVTDALRVMKGPEISDAVLALKRVLGDRAYNERRGFYSFYVDQIHRNWQLPMNGQQGMAEGTGQVEAYGYRYNNRDQRVVWRKNFPSSEAAYAWADKNNATVIGVRAAEKAVDEAFRLGNKRLGNRRDRFKSIHKPSLVETEPTHRIGVTVTDPNHPMVSKRGETVQKSIRVTHADRDAAINRAIAHYRRKGYKVHDHHYMGTVEPGVAEGSLNEFSQGSGGGESGRWYTDDEMTDIVGDGWWQDMDVSGANIGVIDSEVPKEYMIQQAQAWLDDQGYSVQVLNCRVNDDDMEWYIEGSFQNSSFAKKGVAEAKTSAAVRLGRAIDRTQGKTAASQARSVIPSSIPKKEEPKRDEKKVDEGIQAGDGFIIECGDIAIETVVLGNYHDGILIEFDHTATFMLIDHGIVLTEAEYHGRTVPLGKRMAGDVKKSKVYVKKPNGNVVKVNFGDKNMTIKKHLPKHRKSYRARHHCENPGPKWKANYWSCRAW